MLVPFEENTVYLIGGGSGNLKDLTLEADSLLSQAEVILHDMYMDSLQERYSQAKWIHVGKSKGFHVKKQSEINQMLVEMAKSTKRVVRLKAGDPAFFARSSEEISCLKSNGINVQIIPGISSAQLLSKFLCESLTHRQKTRTIAFWSGYWDKEISEVEIPSSDAHIIFMGLAQVHNIIDKFLNLGKPLNTSFIAASNLGRSNQKILYSTLQNAKQDLQKANLENPTLLAIGFEHIFVN
jgi:uroporphyrinogen III methyltransferase/synthase